VNDIENKSLDLQLQHALAASVERGQVRLSESRQKQNENFNHD
jgi:hypothetical protein